MSPLQVIAMVIYTSLRTDENVTRSIFAIPLPIETRFLFTSAYNEDKGARCYCCKFLRHKLGREYLNTNQHEYIILSKDLFLSLIVAIANLQSINSLKLNKFY